MLTAILYLLIPGLWGVNLLPQSWLSAIAYAAVREPAAEMTMSLPEGALPFAPGGQKQESQENPDAPEEDQVGNPDIPEDGSEENSANPEETPEENPNTQDEIHMQEEIPKEDPGVSEGSPDQNPGAVQEDPMAILDIAAEKPEAEAENAPAGRDNPIWNKAPVLWGTAAGIVILAALITLLCLRRLRGKRAVSLLSTKDGGRMNQGIDIANIQGIGAREEQQDSFGVTDVRNLRKGVFAVVADGMGGIDNGEEISRLVTSYMVNSFLSLPDGAYDPVTLLLSMVYGAQNKARAFIEQHGKSLSGSTLVAMVIKNYALYFVSVGDSRICLLRGGALIQLNREHNCALSLDEKAMRGEISLAEARNDPERLALTSFIGLDGQLQIDINTTPLQLMSNDRVILMSDGVFGVLSEDEIVKAASLPSLQDAGAALEQAVCLKNRPCQDNFTAIIIGI